MRGFLVSVLVLAVAAAAAAEVTVKGDPQAWQELMAAQEKLAQARTYRARMSLPGGGPFATVEHVEPDRNHTVIQIGIFRTETITVGSETRTRTGQGPWRCGQQAQQQGASASPPPDARKAEGEATITRLPDTAVEGVPTRGYRVVLVIDKNTIRYNQYVVVDSGLPRRVEILDSADKVVMIMDYYDIGAAITIELPPCQ